MAALDRAIKTFPTIAAFTVAIDSAVNAPLMWKRRGRVPAEWCPSIERATRDQGAVVTCEELRPDVEWSALRDTA